MRKQSVGGGKDKDNLREYPQELLAEAVLFDDD